MRAAATHPPAAPAANEAAFAELVGHAAPGLLRLAERMLGERSEAEDALQEAVISAWRGYGDFRSESQPSTWLHTIVVRACITHIRRHKPTETLDRVDEAARLWADPSYTVDPAEAAVRASERDDLRRALATLPPPYRVSLLLHDMDGYTAAEIADMTAVPLGTAKARIRRARMALVTALTTPTITPTKEPTGC